MTKYARNHDEKKNNSHDLAKIIPISALTPLMIAAKELNDFSNAVEGDSQGSTGERAQTFQKVNGELQLALQYRFEHPASTRKEKSI